MANLCFWEAYIRGEKCKEVVEIMQRDYAYVGTGEFDIQYGMKFVSYKNLNRKHRKHIDSLSDKEKFDLLKRIYKWVDSPALLSKFRNTDVSIEDISYWIDKFPGLVVEKPMLVERCKFATENKEPHMFGVSDVEYVEQADDLLLVSGCCRWSVLHSMMEDSRYYSSKAPYALTIDSIMKKYGTRITIRSIEPSCGLCEILEVDEHGEIVQDECIDYDDLLEESYEDFDDDGWRKYTEDRESMFYSGLKFLKP